MDPMDVPADEFVDVSYRVWTWTQFAIFMGGFALNKVWDYMKWRRDQRREGKLSGANIQGYLKRYLMLAPATLFATAGAFFAWTSGLLPFDYAPDLAFFMGFFSEGFSTHVLKMFRNMANSAAGKPL